MKKVILTAIATLMISTSASAVPIQWTSGSGGNNHWYDFIVLSSGDTWQTSRNAALAMTHIGQSGYLATVTSASENDFLTASVSVDVGYLGGTDEALEGVWLWKDGPEAGTQFWSGAAGGSTTAPDNYANWNLDEPNSGGNLPISDEDYLHTNFTDIDSMALGGWNDILNSGFTTGYFVEFNNAPIPEPGTLAILGLGLAALGVMRRKRVGAPTAKMRGGWA